MSLPISEAFCLVMALAEALGVRRINELPGCWEVQIDDQWWIAVNGHREAKHANPPQSPSTPVEIPPYHVYVDYNGWPAGVFSPRGGIIAAGDAANEGTFCEALKAAAAKARP